MNDDDMMTVIAIAYGYMIGATVLVGLSMLVAYLLGWYTP